MYINPLTAIDFYKADHRRQYPEGTTEVYSNFTARSSRVKDILTGELNKEVVFFGLQYFIKHFLIEVWDEAFFGCEKKHVVNRYKERMDCALGKDSISVEHIEALHDLGYLPIKIKALPEGSMVPIGVPMLTVVNTHPDFFWITNYIESVLSVYLWKGITSSTTALQYKKLLTRYAKTTGCDESFIDFQAHDFSFRGMSSVQDAMISGAAHLTSFFGTDTVLSIDMLEECYGADVKNSLVGCSVPATEHSVMCMGEESGEIETFKCLITETYPSGIVSIVSDTWDFWKVMTEYMPQLKDLIMARDGKVVIRPDSGDPVKIICGDKDAPRGYPEHKGAVRMLWETFGGIINNKGYMELDSHVGLIYGDSITPQIAKEILQRLRDDWFASNNIVFGVGSYTYQYVTRDTYGFAVKATSGVVNGERRDIFKNPKTDNGTKKSAKGLLRVEKENGRYVLYDQQTAEEEDTGELKCVFEDGKIYNETTIYKIRNMIRNNYYDKISRD